MRETILPELTTIEDISVLDPLAIKWSDFSYPNGYFEHNVKKHEVDKPYLISYNYYGTVIYDDIILLINNVEDVFALRPGTVLRIPKIEDLKDFILKQKSKAV